MTRRRYLIAYDIADAKRLRRVFNVMRDHGERLQYSVFLCDLSRAELCELEAAIADIIHFRHDSVIRVDLGSASAPSEIHTLGKARNLPETGARIL